MVILKFTWTVCFEHENVSRRTWNETTVRVISQHRLEKVCFHEHEHWGSPHPNRERWTPKKSLECCKGICELDWAESTYPVG